MEIFTQQTKRLQDLLQEIKLRLSYTRFYMEPEMQKLVLSPEEQQELVDDLRRSFSQTHQRLRTYESELEQLLTVAISLGWTEDDFGSEAPTQP